MEQMKKAAAKNKAAMQRVYEEYKGRFTFLIHSLSDEDAGTGLQEIFQNVWDKIGPDWTTGEEQFELYMMREAVLWLKRRETARDVKAFKRKTTTEYAYKERDALEAVRALATEADKPEDEKHLSIIKCMPAMPRYVYVLSVGLGIDVDRTARIMKDSAAEISRAKDNAETFVKKAYAQLPGAGNAPKEEEVYSICEKAIAKQKIDPETENALAQLHAKCTVPFWARKNVRIAAVVAAVAAVIAVIVCVVLHVKFGFFEKTLYRSDKTEYHAVIEVEDYGNIEIALDASQAPETVKNFIKLAESGFYDGLTFHRIMEGFMIQGGDPEGNGTGGSGKMLKGEFSLNGVNNTLSHTRGAVSMARSTAYDSASSQFFIVQEDTPSLDGSYAVFGYVTSGMDVVDKIAADAEPTDDNGTIPADKQPVIKSITVSE